MRLRPAPGAGTGDDVRRARTVPHGAAPAAPWRDRGAPGTTGAKTYRAAITSISTSQPGTTSPATCMALRAGRLPRSASKNCV